MKYLFQSCQMAHWMLVDLPAVSVDGHHVREEVTAHPYDMPIFSGAFGPSRAFMTKQTMRTCLYRRRASNISKGSNKHGLVLLRIGKHGKVCVTRFS